MACRSLADALEKSEDAERTVITGSLHFIGEATLNTQIMQKLLPDFQKKTGISVVVEQSPYDSLVQKAVLDFAAHKGNYDVLSIPTVILFDGGAPQEVVIGARPAKHFRRGDPEERRR